jgi:hypothetical protein
MHVHAAARARARGAAPRRRRGGAAACAPRRPSPRRAHNAISRPLSDLHSWMMSSSSSSSSRVYSSLSRICCGAEEGAGRSGAARAARGACARPAPPLPRRAPDQPARPHPAGAPHLDRRRLGEPSHPPERHGGAGLVATLGPPASALCHGPLPPGQRLRGLVPDGSGSCSAAPVRSARCGGRGRGEARSRAWAERVYGSGGVRRPAHVGRVGARRPAWGGAPRLRARPRPPPAAQPQARAHPPAPATGARSPRPAARGGGTAPAAPVPLARRRGARPAAPARAARPRPLAPAPPPKSSLAPPSCKAQRSREGAKWAF